MSEILVKPKPTPLADRLLLMFERDPRAPSIRTVIRRQFILMDQAQLYPMLMLLLSGGAILAIGLDMGYPYNIFPLPAFLLASVAWANLVWRAEPPSQRTYHRAMPIDGRLHDLLKISSGAVALMAGAIVILAILTIGVFLGGLHVHLAVNLAVIWFNILAAMMITYLFVSCVPLLTNRPLEWMLGISVAFAALRFLVARSNSVIAQDLLGSAISSKIGIATTLRGMLQPSTWEWYGALNMPRNGVMLEVLPNPLVWLFSLMMWFAAALGAVLWASNRANRRPA